MVPVEILLNFGNYFRTLQLDFWKFLSGIVSLHHYVRTIGLFFSQAHSIWPKPRAFNPDRKSMGTPTFYCVPITKISLRCRHPTVCYSVYAIPCQLIILFLVIMKISSSLWIRPGSNNCADQKSVWFYALPFLRIVKIKQTKKGHKVNK
jgi:hypothetical protein